MNVFVYPNSREIGAAVAKKTAALIREKPDAVIGLPTGSSPMDTYAALVELYRTGSVSFRRVRTFNLDEYLGLPASHPQSFRYFMDEHLFRHIDLPPENITFFNGMAEDCTAELARMDRILDTFTTIDLQLVGIGQNGHVAFNEPADVFSGTSAVTVLSESTRAANRRFFRSLDEVPTRALTLGMGQICRANKIVMIACGAKKAEAVHGMLFGPVTPALPASLLRQARDMDVYVDEALHSQIREQFGTEL